MDSLNNSIALEQLPRDELCLRFSFSLINIKTKWMSL